MGSLDFPFLSTIHTQSTYWAETTDSSLIAFKNYYEKNMLAFEQYYYINENKVVPKGGISIQYLLKA
ncbi:hypothetical protein GQR86_05520 [Providencia vermicola]|nr:hypothetical protein [Providencia sp. G1(2023)]MBC8652856.1 hypothetical protein [Providencia vermicola]